MGKKLFSTLLSFAVLAAVKMFGASVAYADLQEIPKTLELSDTSFSPFRSALDYDVGRFNVVPVEKKYNFLKEDQSIIEEIQKYLKMSKDNNDEKFIWFRNKRSHLQKIIPRQQESIRELNQNFNEIESFVSDLRSDLYAIRNDIERIDVDIRQMKVSLDTNQAKIDELTSKSESLDKQIESNRKKNDNNKSHGEADESDSHAKKIGENEIYELEDEKKDILERQKYLQFKRDVIKGDMESRSSRRLMAEARVEELEKEIENAERMRPLAIEAINEISMLSIKTSQSLRDLDDAIYVLLIPETEDNKFKLNVTLSFTGLVLIVIAGFFAVSWKDAEVRRSIFSSQSGIQFLTLFSLVIAIILFGILDVLEGKELAALLGGLSGYILGRVTGGDRPDRAESTPDRSAARRVGASRGKY